MPIHTDDLLEKLDRVLSQPYLAPATHCGWCKEELTGDEASLDFCEPQHQLFWYMNRSAGHAKDEGRGWDGWDVGRNIQSACDGVCCASDHDEARRWANMGLGRAYEVNRRLIERENEQRLVRLRRGESVERVQAHIAPPDPSSYAARIQGALARWLGLDPDC